ncbi:MAG: hypothetical protein ABSH51_01865 [Solirubrobacteraceae bacterium]|jgi:hypothetical protein
MTSIDHHSSDAAARPRAAAPRAPGSHAPGNHAPGNHALSARDRRYVRAIDGWLAGRIRTRARQLRRAGPATAPS